MRGPKGPPGIPAAAAASAAAGRGAFRERRAIKKTGFAGAGKGSGNAQVRDLERAGCPPPEVPRKVPPGRLREQVTAPVRYPGNRSLMAGT
ncbi:MAG: hypothetical protein LBE17_01315, partial [Treponema sp.]|nr:hypothetical protein [Treponema sp.]